MKCRYETTWLTGTPWQEDCGEVQWQAAQQIQQDALIRASTPFLASRGNALDTIIVPIALQHADQGAALSHIAQLPWALPGQGLPYFADTIGNVTTHIFFPAAAWQGCRRKRTGIASELEFSFAVLGPPTINTTTSGVTPPDEHSTGVPANALRAENGLPLLTESGQFILVEP
jgi:hypothetical protein